MSVLRRLLRIWLIAASTIAFVACAGNNATHSSASADAAAAAETRMVDRLALKAHYSGVVTGTEVKGATLVVYVDVNALYSMDEGSESQMRSDTLAQWKRIWKNAHPGKHGNVRVSLHDYYGTEVASDTAKV